MLQRDPGSGSLLLADGISLANECCCEDAPAAPCACPGGLLACYQISGYSNTFFSNCILCTQNALLAPWDGQFDLSSACLWSGYSGETLVRINENIGETGILHLVTTGTCRWRIALTCQGAGNPFIWEGEKVTGLTPEGVYTQTAGCSGPASLTIIPC